MQIATVGQENILACLAILTGNHFLGIQLFVIKEFCCVLLIVIKLHTSIRVLQS